MFGDDTERLVRAAAYLEKHRALHGALLLSDEEQMLIYELRSGRLSVVAA